MSCKQSFPKSTWQAVIKQKTDILTLKAPGGLQTGTIELQNKVFYSMSLSGNLVCINEPSNAVRESIIGNPNTLSIITNLIPKSEDEFLNELSWQPDSYQDGNGTIIPGFSFSLGLIGAVDVRGSRVKSDLILDGSTQTFLEIDRDNQVITVWYV